MRGRINWLADAAQSQKAVTSCCSNGVFCWMAGPRLRNFWNSAGANTEPSLSQAARIGGTDASE